MKKKIILLSLCMLMFLTGCGGSYNSSPDAVAEEMAKRLSEGDYKKISELIYLKQSFTIYIVNIQSNTYIG